MSSRCPKCGKNNYGDVKKCSFCGSPLTFIPGEEVKEVSEEDIQEKMSKMKVERLRNPMMMGIGGIVGVIGFVLMVILFLVMMFFVYSPSSIEPAYENGAWHYKVDGGEQLIFGEITAITSYDETNWDGGNHGYEELWAFEIDGDGDDNRVLAFREGNVDIEPDVWVYTDKDIGKVGDRVLIRVESRNNDFDESRAIATDYAPWGGRGWKAGWPWVLPGFLVLLGGVTVFLIGLIGRADRSMERLMAEDEELRRQQIMLKEAARKQMEAKKKQNQWAQDGQSAVQQQPPPGQYPEPQPEMVPPQQPVGENQQTGQAQPQPAVQTPPPGQAQQQPVSQAPPQDQAQQQQPGSQPQYQPPQQ